MIEINLNEVVLVKGIGYGALIDCHNKKSVKVKSRSLPFDIKKQESTNDIGPLFNQSPTIPVATVDSTSSAIQPSHAPVQQSEKKQETSIIESSNFVTVNLIPSQALVHTHVDNITNTVMIRVKTFFSSRAELSLDVNVASSLDSLKKLIFDKLNKDMSLFFNIRLFYSGLELRQISRPLYLEQVPELTKLVMLAQTTFSLTPGQNVTGVKLSRNNMTATKNGDQNYSTCFGTALMESDGRYYWEFKLDNFTEVEDIFIGVANRGIDAQACPTHSGGYWGYMPLFAKRFSHEEIGNLIDYGYSHKIGDNVGVLLHIKKGEGTLMFFRSGMCCGKAFEGIPVPICPAVTFVGTPNTVVQVTMDPRAPLPSYDLN